MESRMLTVVVVIAGLCGSAALAGGPLGPPGATAPAGKWVIDAGYFYEEMDLDGWGWQMGPLYRETDVNATDPNNITYTWGDWSDPNESMESNLGTHLTLTNFKTNTWLASIEYGLWENCTVYVRAGMADAKADVNFRTWQEVEGNGYYGWVDDGGSAEFDYGFAWQVGSNFTFYRSGPWTFGGRMQFGAASPDSYSYSWRDDWSGTYDTIDVNGYEAASGTVDLDWWQSLAYLGGTYQVNDQLQLYGGGGWQTLHGTVDHSETLTAYATSATPPDGPTIDLDPPIPAWQERASSSYKIRHASAIGIFGAGWQPRENIRVCGEFLIGENGKWGWGITGAIAIP